MVTVLQMVTALCCNCFAWWLCCYSWWVCVTAGDTVLQLVTLWYSWWLCVTDTDGDFLLCCIRCVACQPDSYVVTVGDCVTVGEFVLQRVTSCDSWWLCAVLQLVSVVWETCLLDPDLVRNITTFYISQARILLNIVKSLQEVSRTTLILLLCGCSS